MEQKNCVQVRALYGYGRIGCEPLIRLMNRINVRQGLIKNLFTPTMRLLPKGAPARKCVKRYEKEPKTPAQRVLESPAVPEDKEARSARCSRNTTSLICGTH